MTLSQNKQILFLIILVYYFTLLFFIKITLHFHQNLTTFLPKLHFFFYKTAFIPQNARTTFEPSRVLILHRLYYQFRGHHSQEVPVGNFSSRAIDFSMFCEQISIHKGFKRVLYDTPLFQVGPPMPAITDIRS